MDDNGWWFFYAICQGSTWSVWSIQLWITAQGTKQLHARAALALKLLAEATRSSYWWNHGCWWILRLQHGWMEMDSLKIWGPIRSLVFFPSWEMWLQGLKWRYASFEFLKTFEFKRSILVLQTLELLKLHSLWRFFCCRITAGIFRKQNHKRRTCSFSYSTSYSNSPSWFNSCFNNLSFNIKRYYIYIYLLNIY